MPSPGGCWKDIEYVEIALQLTQITISPILNPIKKTHILFTLANQVLLRPGGYLRRKIGLGK